jgi:hypothetical protein
MSQFTSAAIKASAELASMSKVYKRRGNFKKYQVQGKFDGIR